MTTTSNEIVREMEQFLDRLLDPSLTQADRLLYLNARALGLRERVRFLSIPESEQVGACAAERDRLLGIVAALLLEHGRKGDDGTSLSVGSHLLRKTKHGFSLLFTNLTVPTLFGYRSVTRFTLRKHDPGS